MHGVAALLARPGCSPRSGSPRPMYQVTVTMCCSEAFYAGEQDSLRPCAPDGSQVRAWGPGMGRGGCSEPSPKSCSMYLFTFPPTTPPCLVVMVATFIHHGQERFAQEELSPQAQITITHPANNPFQTREPDCSDPCTNADFHPNPSRNWFVL